MNRLGTLPFDPFYGAVLDSVAALAAGTFGELSLGALGQDPSYLAEQNEAIVADDRSASAWDYVSGEIGRENTALLEDVTTEAAPRGLTAKNIFDRMTAITCAGCHANETVEEAHLDLGGIARPFSLGFQHINEWGVLSMALRTTFLPQRRAHWDEVVGAAACDPGDDDTTSTSSSTSTGGWTSSSTGGSSSSTTGG